MEKVIEQNYEELVINELSNREVIKVLVDFIIEYNLQDEFYKVLVFISRAKREDIILNGGIIIYKISSYLSNINNRELFKKFLIENESIWDDNRNFYLKILSNIDSFHLGTKPFNRPIYNWEKLDPVNNLWKTPVENIRIKVQDYISKLLILNGFKDNLFFKIWNKAYYLFKSNEYIYWSNLENISLLDLVWTLNVNQESRKVVELTLSKFQSYKVTNIYDIFDISWKKIIFLEFLVWKRRIKALIDAFWNLLELQWIFDLEKFKLEKVQVWRDIFIKFDWTWIIDKDFNLLKYNKINIDNIYKKNLNWTKYLINWTNLVEWDEFEKYLMNNYIAFNTSDIEVQEIYD